MMPRKFVFGRNNEFHPVCPKCGKIIAKCYVTPDKKQGQKPATEVINKHIENCKGDKE